MNATMKARIARLVLPVLAIAACMNLAAGAALALRDPSRASDLWIMYRVVRPMAGRRGTVYGGRYGHRLSTECDRRVVAPGDGDVALARAALDGVRPRAGAAPRMSGRPLGLARRSIRGRRADAVVPLLDEHAHAAAVQRAVDGARVSVAAPRRCPSPGERRRARARALQAAHRRPDRAVDGGDWTRPRGDRRLGGRARRMDGVRRAHRREPAHHAGRVSPCPRNAPCRSRRTPRPDGPPRLDQDPLRRSSSG